ncbi:MAG: class I SAM-dependent methyltransferase [Kiloniellaceae bacterium]
MRDSPGGLSVINGKIIRTCIICGSDDYSPIFTYTYKFLKDVRGSSAASLEKRGWSEDVTSTIVKCSRCACIYIRDVFVPSRRRGKGPSDHDEGANTGAETPLRIMAKEGYKYYKPFDNQNWVVRNLVLLAADRQGRDIKFLDFGAGGGEASNAARVCGVRDVVAYDPNYPVHIQEQFGRTNFPGIRCVRSKDELVELGPFDVVVFQSVVEHVLDPRSELKTIYHNMSKGGYLYINNPFMDLDHELEALLAATKIEKKDSISHYHPGHLNYMTPGQFSRLLKDAGFRITPMVHHPPLPLARGHLGRYLIRNIKCGIRLAQNILGVPYSRHFFVVRKPG